MDNSGVPSADFIERSNHSRMSSRTGGFLSRAAKPDRPRKQVRYHLYGNLPVWFETTAGRSASLAPRLPNPPTQQLPGKPGGRSLGKFRRPVPARPRWVLLSEQSGPTNRRRVRCERQFERQRLPKPGL